MRREAREDHRAWSTLPAHDGELSDGVAPGDAEQGIRRAGWAALVLLCGSGDGGKG